MLHVVFDADVVRLAFSWKGRFFDAMGCGSACEITSARWGPGFDRSSAGAIVRGARQFSMQGWPDTQADVQEPGGAKFKGISKGYELR